MDIVKVSASQAQAFSMQEPVFYRHYLYLYQHCPQNYLERPSHANIRSMGRTKLTTVAWRCDRIDLPLPAVSAIGRAAVGVEP